MATFDTPGVLETAITRAIVDRAHQIMEEEAERAAQKVRERMKDLAPELAMSVIRMFEINRNRDNIVITVRNELVDTPA